MHGKLYKSSIYSLPDIQPSPSTIRKAQPLLLNSVKHGVDSQDVVLATEGLFWLTLSHQFLNRNDLSAKAESFVLHGSPKTYVKTTADSGNKRRHAFCGTCGTPRSA